MPGGTNSSSGKVRKLRLATAANNDNNTNNGNYLPLVQQQQQEEEMAAEEADGICNQTHHHFECRVCHAHATGFHFGAQSCQACCAFFRRTVSLNREYKCKQQRRVDKTAGGDVASTAAKALALSVVHCRIHYSEKTLCRACRLAKCLAIGMDRDAVQAKGNERQLKERTYFTKSGLMRNKHFARGALKVLFDEDNKAIITKCVVNPVAVVEPFPFSGCPSKLITEQQQQQQQNGITTTTTAAAAANSVPTSPCHSPPVWLSSTTIGASNSSGGAQSRCQSECTEAAAAVPMSPKHSTPSKTTTTAGNQQQQQNQRQQQHHQHQLPEPLPQPPPIIHLAARSPPQWNLLKLLVDEEMRIGERRRILFCERPVTSLLGKNKACPFTRDDIKPLRFQEFRRSIRTHILLIYEWLRMWPGYEQLRMDDQITLLRKCVLYHTVLDPCFLTIQVGDMGKFVLPNAGYVSTKYPPDEGGGWADEPEISHETKVKIYWPLLVPLMSGCVAPMLRLGLKFEEFVALKAIVSLQMTLADISFTGRALVSRELESLCRALSQFYAGQPEYADNQLAMAERFGNLLLLLTPIIDTANTFVESHHIVQFFDLWQMDSLMLQFLQKKEC